MSKGAPDYSKIALLTGLDASGNVVTVLLDATGKIISVLQGLDGTTLRTLAVDPSGQVIMVPRRQSGNYMLVDSDGYLAALMKGNDSGTLRSIAVDIDGKLLAVMQGDYAGTLKTINLDADGHMTGVMSLMHDFAGYWAGTVSRLVCDISNLKFIDALPTNTRCVQRYLDAQATGASIGSVSIAYATGYTYYRSIAGSAVLNDKDAIIFLKSLSAVSITVTNVTVNQIIIDYNAANFMKGVPELLGGNAEKGTDEDFSTATTYRGAGPTYIEVLRWDMGSVKSIGGWMYMMGNYVDTAGAAGQCRMESSENGTTWTAREDYVSYSSTAEALRYVSKRETTPFSARYLRFFSARSAGTGLAYQRCYEFLAYV